ncbi:MAG: hypothetical protein LBT79_02410 [Elusimicrobiota bacterium]|jgi:hypothetical protein|nr:hypothetical protein [Elusimicrobiota bacterium]
MNDEVFVLIVLGWIALACINAFIAEQKNRRYGLILFFSIILSPFIMYLYILAVPPLAKIDKDKSNL